MLCIDSVLCFTKGKAFSWGSTVIMFPNCTPGCSTSKYIVQMNEIWTILARVTWLWTGISDQILDQCNSLFQQATRGRNMYCKISKELMIIISQKATLLRSRYLRLAKGQWSTTSTSGFCLCSPPLDHHFPVFSMFSCSVSMWAAFWVFLVMNILCSVRVLLLSVIIENLYYNGNK